MSNRECLEQNRQLKSENALMSGSLKMLKRENSVIREENIDYKRSLSQNVARVESLESENRSIREKHVRDIALWKNRFNGAVAECTILKKESSEKIKELTELKNTIEARLSADIAGLNEALRKNEQDRGKEREDLKKQLADREYVLSNEIEVLKKAVARKEGEVADLTEKNRELVMQAKEAQERLEILVGEKSKSMETIQSLNEQLQQQKKLTEEALKSSLNETKAP
jgi:chromosome segregation ATPase